MQYNVHRISYSNYSPTNKEWTCCIVPNICILLYYLISSIHNPNNHNDNHNHYHNHNHTHTHNNIQIYNNNKKKKKKKGFYKQVANISSKLPSNWVSNTMASVLVRAINSMMVKTDCSSNGGGFWEEEGEELDIASVGSFIDSIHPSVHANISKHWMIDDRVIYIRVYRIENRIEYWIRRDQRMEQDWVNYRSSLRIGLYQISSKRLGRIARWN